MIYDFMRNLWQLFGRINDWIFRGGADFSQWMSREEIGITKEDGSQYQPSSDLLYFVLRRLKPNKADCIIDIGCGKGRAMWVMSKFNFGTISGYDISKDLVRIANQNFAKLNLINCSAEYGDAADYTEYDNYNYFYISNPVPLPVFRKMLDNIYDSLGRRPRKAIMIYMNPICDLEIQKDGIFKLQFVQKHLIKWYRFNIYRYDV